MDHCTAGHKANLVTEWHLVGCIVPYTLGLSKSDGTCRTVAGQVELCDTARFQMIVLHLAKLLILILTCNSSFPKQSHFSNPITVKRPVKTKYNQV